ncbi:MAG TPA: DUF4412 domain-containing protein [Steroidobacteraceae bacterium]
MRTVLSCVSAILFSSAASAGVYLESAQRSFEADQEKPQVQRMWFDGGRLRMESGDEVMIFRNQTLYTIDRPEKTYVKIDRATMDRLGNRLADAQRQMQAQLANMPPEQRAMVEKMMGEHMGAITATAKKNRAVTKTGRTEKAAGFTCTVWEITVDGKKEQEMCVVAPGALPSGDEVMQTFRELGAMFENFVDKLPVGGDLAREVWSDLKAVNGIPVITRDFENGKPVEESRMTAIRSEAPPAGAFDIPSGYREEKMDF